MTDQNNNTLNMNQLLQAINELASQVKVIGESKAEAEGKVVYWKLKYENLKRDYDALAYKYAVSQKELTTAKERIKNLEAYMDVIEKSIPLEDIHNVAKKVVDDDNYLEVLKSDYFLSLREESAKSSLKTNFSRVSTIAKEMGYRVGSSNDYDNLTLSASHLGRKVRETYYLALQCDPYNNGNGFYYWIYIEKEIAKVIIQHIYALAFPEVQ